MIERRSVPGTDKDVSRLVLGSVGLHIDEYEKAEKMLDAFASIGGNTIDMSHCYGLGRCTKTIGLWMAERGNRSEIVLFDKGCHPYGSPRFSPEFLESDAADNRGWLGVDSVDFFVFHRDDPSVPIEVMAEKMQSMKDRGLVDYFGGSNWSLPRVQEMKTSLPDLFVLNNPNLSLATVNEPMWDGCYTAAAEDREWHSATQFPLFSWSSMGGGWFASVDSDDVRRVYDNPVNQGRRDRVIQLGSEKGLSPTQLALAYTLNQPYPIWALVGPRSVDELLPLADAVSVKLSPDELTWLESGE